jgi:4'-phosphopantetheinyl transferase EntD
MVQRRAWEFAAGRLCARRALAEFGIVDFPIVAAADRQPIWPRTMVGSITHTTGFCAAVVAERRHFAALGLDSEVVGDLKVQIWPSICVPAEIAWIRSQPTSQQAAAITLIFSAKEAFYKCQYPLVNERLLFHDVVIEVSSWDASAGSFQVQATRSIAVAKRTRMPVAGRYLLHEGLVTAGLGVPAAEGSVQ